jgi:hypothetical protein
MADAQAGVIRKPVVKIGKVRVVLQLVRNASADYLRPMLVGLRNDEKHAFACREICIREHDI